MSKTAVVGETCPRCLWSFVPRCKCGGRIVGEIPRDEDDEDEEDDEKPVRPGPVCVSCRTRYYRGEVVARCGCGIRRCEDVLAAAAEWKGQAKALDPRRTVDQDRWAPRPPCCDTARLTRGQQESMGWDFPFVYLSLDGQGWRVGGHPATCCPFCGARLPEVEIDPDATGRFAEGDDCGHCMSCGRRYCGLCKPPSARFRIKASPS